MAYTDIYTAATDEAHILRKQTAVAIHKAAADVIVEAPSTDNHAARLTWARRILTTNNGPVAESESWIWKVLENATIQADPANATDSDVQYVVNLMVNDMADK